MKITFSPQNNSFGNLKREPGSIDEKLFNEISTSPAMNNFSKKYDATISIDHYMSKKNDNKTSLFVVLENIKPKSIIEKIKNKLTGNKINSSIILKTHATNQAELINSLKKVEFNKVKELLFKK